MDYITARFSPVKMTFGQMKIQIELLQPNLIASLTRDSSLAALYDVFICKKLSYTQSTAFFFF